MERPNKVASRYAKAIYDSLKEGSKVREVLAELEGFSQVVEKHPDLKRVLTTETFHAIERREIIDDLVKKLGLSDFCRRLLLVVSDAKRLVDLRGITQKLRLMLLEAAQVVPMEVLAAGPLSNDEKQRIEQRFNKILGKKIEASYLVDAALIGGLRVTAGSRTFDGTLAGWLATFEEQLVGGTI